MIGRTLIAALIISLAQPTSAASFYFCWQGDGGYTMTGKIAFPDAKMTQRLITEADVTAFQIIGYLNGEKIGAWNMHERTDRTTWHLRFDPATLTFPTGGSFRSDRSQGWNADGTTRNCGSPGFGFNSGNAGQDVCVDSTYIAPSRIPPPVPFVASTTPVSPDCRQSVPLS